MAKLEEQVRYPKKVLIAIPPEFLKKVDKAARQEHRTRSDLIREALRKYLTAIGEMNNVPTTHPTIG